MDSISAFAMGESHRNDPSRVFDWDKAARLIVERNPSYVRAGLQNDWEWTGGLIYENKHPVQDYTFLASTWAIPEIDIDGEVEDCFIMMDDSPNWDAGTKWPASALKILEEAGISTEIMEL